MQMIPAPPGRLFDVGGFRLHIQSTGDGSPAAIMDSGLTGNSLVWSNTLVEIGKFTKACAFDRAGYAWSDAAPPGVPRTSRQIVDELRLLLQRAGIPPPYILLGHSFGAINMLVYAYHFPAEVAGLVLVDPSHPEMMERIPQIPDPAKAQYPFKLIAFLGRIGLLGMIGPRLVRRLIPDGPQYMPPGAWQALEAIASRPGDFTTAAREMQFFTESFAQAKGAPGSLGSLPLEILSADYWTKGKPTPIKTGSNILREEMKGLSSCSRLTIVENCDHSNLPVVRPDAVAASVKRIITLQPA